MNNTINKMDGTKEVNNTEAINFMDVLTEQLTTINLIDKQKAREEDFIFRLVICYTDKDKEQAKEQYALISDLINKINRLTFKYAIKDNKYCYLINKEDFSSVDVFKARQKTDKKGHIQLINLKNIEVMYNKLNMYLIEKLVKQEKATEEEKATYNKTMDLIKKAIEEKKKQKEQEKKQATEDTKQAK